MSLLEKIEAGPVLADSPTESALLSADFPFPACPPELCLSQPELISQIHTEAIAAGAQILRTNSLGAHPGLLQHHGLAERVNEINWQASQIAKQAAQNSGAIIAGRVGPLGLSQEELQATDWDREECFRIQIGALLDGGANAIWLEGFQDLDDLVLALEVKHSLHHCPAICSLALPLPQTAPALSKIIRTLIDNDAEILGCDGANATLTLEALQASDLASNHTPDAPPLAVLLTAGSDPESFARDGLALFEAGAAIVGGGRGTGPEHIAALARRLAPTEKETT